MNTQSASLNEIFNKLRLYMPELEERYSVRALGVFGSYVRGEQNKRSDLDLLVDFSDPPGLLKYLEMKYYLSDILGVKVDLVMRDALKPGIGKRILAEVINV